MVKGIIVILFFASPVLADQIGSTYKRNLMLFQFVEFGSTFTDVSTHTFSTVQNGSGNAIITGKNGLAWSENGSGDFVLSYLTSIAPDNTVSDFTILASVRMTGLTNALSCIFCQPGSSVGTFLGGFRNHKLAFIWDPQGAACISDLPIEIDTTLGMSSGTWHLIGFNRLNNQIKSIWLDGVMVASDTTSDCTSLLDVQMEIGGNAGATNTTMKGDIDELTFWKTYMTPGEMRRLYRDWEGRRKWLLEPSRNISSQLQ